MYLTERDYEIVAFVLNMKFATITDIHNKFFKLRKDGVTSTSEWYARERCRMLMNEGYLTTIRYRVDNKNFYLATNLGYKMLKKIYCVELAKPTHRIDLNTFNHDQKVMQARLYLEDKKLISEWFSDKQLKTMRLKSLKTDTNQDNWPDAVYMTNGMVNIAFEYEIAQKAKHRYVDKIRSYVRFIRYTKPIEGRFFDHVHVVCETVPIKKIFLEETRIYREYFTIESAEEFYRKTSLAKPSTDKQIPGLTLVH